MIMRLWCLEVPNPLFVQLFLLAACMDSSMNARRSALTVSAAENTTPWSEGWGRIPPAEAPFQEDAQNAEPNQQQQTNTLQVEKQLQKFKKLFSILIDLIVNRTRKLRVGSWPCPDSEKFGAPQTVVNTNITRATCTQSWEAWNPWALHQFIFPQKWSWQKKTISDYPPGRDWQINVFAVCDL